MPSADMIMRPSV